MAYIEVKHSYKPYQVGETEIVTNNDITDYNAHQLTKCRREDVGLVI